MYMDFLSGLVEKYHLKTMLTTSNIFGFNKPYLDEFCISCHILQKIMEITSKNGRIKSKINGIFNNKKYEYDFHFNNIWMKQSSQID